MAAVNIYADETPLLARLQAAMPTITVASLDAITGTRDLTSQCPGVYISGDATAISSSTNSGKINALKPRWEVTIIVNNQDASGDPALTRIGDLLRQVFDALIGYEIERFSPLKLVDILPPAYGPRHTEQSAAFERDAVMHVS